MFFWDPQTTSEEFSCTAQPSTYFEQNDKSNETPHSEGRVSVGHSPFLESKAAMD